MARAKKLRTGAEAAAAVAASDARRSEMIERFGFMPLSVLTIKRGSLGKQMFHLQLERGKAITNARSQEPGADPALADRRLRTSEAGSTHGKAGQVWSIMSAELVDFFIKYYAPAGGVYLDPFMGQGVQMQVAHLRGMTYHGYDCCQLFYDYVEGVADKIDPDGARLFPNLGDSRNPTAIPDGIGDFSFHSPPYWDLEDYGDAPAQLGKGNTYEVFLAGMTDVARAWLPKFKPGAYHVVNVNDFTREGRFYPYHADTITAFRAGGWELVDTWIVSGLVAGLPMVFAESFNRRRRAPKVHEFALVFRRPLA